MPVLSRAEGPSPALFFQTATAHIRTAALKTAIELDLFTGIGEGNRTFESLLKKIYASLSDGGKIITLEYIPNEDRVSPPEMAEFCLIMLTTTPAGDAYTFSEYQRMFQNAGYSQSEVADVPASNQRVIITQK